MLYPFVVLLAALVSTSFPLEVCVTTSQEEPLAGATVAYRVTDDSFSGSVETAATGCVQIAAPVREEPRPSERDELVVHEAYPNPAHATPVRLPMRIADAGQAEVGVYDARGRRVGA